MGIPKLTSFMRQRFGGWKEEEIKGPLVIDGDALCYNLYDPIDWKHGGEYVQFHAYAVEYFTALKASSIEPIVVFDGIDYTGEKSETILGRYDQSAQRICAVFQPTMTQLSELVPTPQQGHAAISSDKVVIPTFVKKVLSDVLNELHIEFVVVDGEADKETALLANFYSCPVLSNDSDFYIYPVTGGFIHMNDFNWRLKPIMSKVYHIKSLADQFKFSDESLRFIIPAISGNDFMEALSYNCREFSRHMKRVTFNAVGISHPTAAIVAYISHYDNFQDFINRIQSIEYLNESWKRTLRGNCIKSRQMYDIRGVRSLDNLRCESALQIDESREIPRWLLRQYRQLKLSSGMMITVVCGGYVLPVLAENPNRETAYCISLPLRQAAYNILGLGERSESLRVGEDFESFDIPPCTIKCDGIRLNNIALIPTLPKSTKKKIIYYFLLCDGNKIERLDVKWRLVIASVIFWAKRANAEWSAVKALLLTFVLCSSGTQATIESPDEIPANSPEWFEGIHYFMQWQCSYKDASSLNSVLQMPLEFYSPAYIYSGKLALKLYTASETKSLLSQIPRKLKEAYDQLLSTVTSHTGVVHSATRPSVACASSISSSELLKDTVDAHNKGLLRKYVLIK